jgi:hypothetical protein
LRPLADRVEALRNGATAARLTAWLSSLALAILGDITVRPVLEQCLDTENNPRVRERIEAALGGLTAHNGRG